MPKLQSVDPAGQHLRREPAEPQAESVSASHETPGALAARGLLGSAAPLLRRFASGDDPLGGRVASDDVMSVLRRRSGRGKPLPDPIQRQMGAQFGVSLATIRIHHDEEAGGVAEAVQSDAFTHGRDIYFSRGRFDPASESGRHLLAHELTHATTTERQGGPAAMIGRADDPAEHAAEATADRVVAALRRGSNAGGHGETTEGFASAQHRIAGIARMIRRVASVPLLTAGPAPMSGALVAHHPTSQRDSARIRPKSDEGSSASAADSAVARRKPVQRPLAAAALTVLGELPPAVQRRLGIRWPGLVPFVATLPEDMQVQLAWGVVDRQRERNPEAPVRGPSQRLELVRGAPVPPGDVSDIAAVLLGDADLRPWMQRLAEMIPTGVFQLWDLPPWLAAAMMGDIEPNPAEGPQRPGRLPASLQPLLLEGLTEVQRRRMAGDSRSQVKFTAVALQNGLSRKADKMAESVNKIAPMRQNEAHQRAQHILRNADTAMGQVVAATLVELDGLLTSWSSMGSDDIVARCIAKLERQFDIHATQLRAAVTKYGKQPVPPWMARGQRKSEPERSDTAEFSNVDEGAAAATLATIPETAEGIEEEPEKTFTKAAAQKMISDNPPGLHHASWELWYWNLAEDVQNTSGFDTERPSDVAVMATAFQEYLDLQPGLAEHRPVVQRPSTEEESNARLKALKHDNTGTWVLNNKIKYLNGVTELDLGDTEAGRTQMVTHILEKGTVNGAHGKPIGATLNSLSHYHTDGGSHGVSYVYYVEADYTVTACVYDYSTGRVDGNRYKWKNASNDYVSDAFKLKYIDFNSAQVALASAAKQPKKNPSGGKGNQKKRF